MAILVFSDLDGTLLNHEDYSWLGAEATLERMTHEEIPLVLVTSKTKAEVEHLRRQLRLKEPYVVENGAAVFFPPRYQSVLFAKTRAADGWNCIQLGVEYGALRNFVREVQSRIRIRGFGDMSDGEVARLTSLTGDEAHRARQRDFTEPVILGDSSRAAELEALARKRGLRLTRGGRFRHLVGAEQGKGKAVRLVQEVVASADPAREWITVGAGDSPNDLCMLQAVDIPVVIPHQDGPRIEIEGAIVADRPGSAGWGEAIAQALDTCGGRSEKGRT